MVDQVSDVSESVAVAEGGGDPVTRVGAGVDTGAASVARGALTRHRKKARRRSKKALIAIAEARRAKYSPLTDDGSLHIEQYRSSIRQPLVQRKQLQALGLGRLGKSKVVPNIPVFAKLVDRLKHLVRVK
ncbi:MAG: mitochondrial large ribosomal subunit protein uL30m [Holosporales bacterium]|jgi:ribosomal protein L30|nr:mitochondrial large ribosomal subunit protein uL30m [Holosporales bacterium]